MIPMPYWLSWVILIAGLIGAFGFGWSACRNRHTQEHEAALNRYTISLERLTVQSDQRTQVLNYWVKEVSEHLKTCPDAEKTPQAQTPIRNPVTGEILGYVIGDKDD